RRHMRWPRDWSSDVCSSDLAGSYPRQALRLSGPLGRGVMPVAGNSRLVMDDRLPGAEKAVEERRLSDIRPADDGKNLWHDGFLRESEERRVGKECTFQGGTV